MSLNGPEAARLYDQHVDAVYAYAARRIGADAAVSVVEDVFEQALRKNAERPKHTPTDLGWLLALTTAFLRRHTEAECRRLRSWQPAVSATSKAIPRVSDPLLSSDGEDPSITATAQVMAAVADLEPVDRDVLFLVAWEGCSSALTATATGLAQNEIRPTLARIRKEIRSRVAAAQAPPSSPSPSPSDHGAGRSDPDVGSTDRAVGAAAVLATESSADIDTDTDTDAGADDVTETEAETEAETDIDWGNLEWSDSPTADDETASTLDIGTDTEDDTGTGTGTGTDDSTLETDDDDATGPSIPDEPDTDATDTDATEPIVRSADPFAMPLASWDEDPS